MHVPLPLPLSREKMSIFLPLNLGSCPTQAEHRGEQHENNLFEVINLSSPPLTVRGSWSPKVLLSLYAEFSEKMVKILSQNSKVNLKYYGIFI